MQVHGGMGFIEETGAAQYLRDVRVTAIYEGTNGIQAMDLVGRKMMDGGEAAFRLLDEIAGRRPRPPAPPCPSWPSASGQAAETLREATEWLVAQRHAGPFRRRRALSAGLRPGAGRACPPARRAWPRAGRPAQPRWRAFYIRRLLPEHAALAGRMRAPGRPSSMPLSPEDLAA